MGLIEFICLYAITVSARCYVPNGTPRVPEYDYTYQPCDTSSEFSMCCAWNRTYDADTCLGNGLCYNPIGDYYWRESCTDPTWTSEACSPICRSGLIDPYNSSMGDWSGTDEPLTKCQDGTWCCGYENLACCSESLGVRLDSTRLATSASLTSSLSTSPTFSLTSIVPALSLERITEGPPTAPTPHSSIPTYSNTGVLLQGYCANAEFVLLDGPTAYWVPAVGCVGDKTDCCPYIVQQTASLATITVVSTSTVTVSVDPSGVNSPYAGVQAYPTPASSNQATLAHCPDDYVSVSGGCCPSGYKLWNAKIGGETPCYSSLSSTVVPPAVPVTTSEPMSVPSVSGAASSSTNPQTTANQKPTSAIVNIVYAVQFPVQPSTGLSTGIKAGIGVGGGVAGIAIFALAWLLIWRTRKQKKAEETLTAMQTTAPDMNSNGQSQSGTAVSPYAYSTRTDLQTDGGPHSPMRSPGGFVPTEQNAYFQPQQIQHTQPAQYYGQQPMQQMPPMQQFAPDGNYGQQPLAQMQGQSPVHYQSTGANMISPTATGSDGYGSHSGYAASIPSPTGARPPSELYGYQTGYVEVQGSGPQNVAASPVLGHYQGPYNPPGTEHYPLGQELHGQSV